jgi:hypothetical protein
MRLSGTGLAALAIGFSLAAATAQVPTHSPDDAAFDFLLFKLRHPHGTHKDVQAKPDSTSSEGDAPAPGDAGEEPGSDIHFTGQSIADAQAARDVAEAILAIAADKLHCATADAIQAEPLPASYVPSAKPDFAAHQAIVYERWTVSLCGQQAAFLLGFWPTPNGMGTGFGVGYPFSADAGKPAS